MDGAALFQERPSFHQTVGFPIFTSEKTPNTLCFFNFCFLGVHTYLLHPFHSFGRKSCASGARNLCSYFQHTLHIDAFYFPFFPPAVETPARHDSAAKRWRHRFRAAMALWGLRFQFVVQRVVSSLHISTIGHVNSDHGPTGKVNEVE